MKKISVIVPVYNVEKYLATCLDSLIDQGVDENDYEIILVNDGSTDNSLNICNSYADKHPNICVYSQENQGLPAARNTGLAKAVGQWVMFVDSDDYICKDSLNYLLTNYCDNRFDCIRFWIRIRSDATIDKQMTCEGEVKYECTGYEFIKQYGLETFCVSFLYKRSYLQSKGICFSPVRFAEDFLFTSQFMLSNPVIRSTSSKVYQYLIHSNSLSTSRNRQHSRMCAFEQLKINDILLGNISNKGIRDSDPLLYEKCINSLRAKMTIIFSRLLSSDVSVREFKTIIEKQKQISILPLNANNGLNMSKVSVFFINLLVRLPWLFLPVKVLYSKFFVPFILPRLDRNR
jgi:glycosyltransferase involved in cell wall biosynthesis